MKLITINTDKKDQVLDITSEIEKYIESTKFKKGLCAIFVAHTTCSLTTADLDPGTDLDILDALRNLIPKMDFRHPHNPGHTPDHILSSLIGTSLTIPFERGRLLLGTWQRVVLIEFDGPRQREIQLSLIEDNY